ncbi:MAG TPA: ATP-binding protein [Pyrinomonadaceae bacterium]|nr:ATP-binding protein [Pyrinomonadaceae bacterium]
MPNDLNSPSPQSMQFVRESAGKASPKPEPVHREGIQRLIFGRLALVFLLLLASWWWTGSYLGERTETFPTGLFLFFLCSVVLTGIYHVIAYFDRDYPLQKRFQFFIDVVLVTWLVWETGDINSPYVSLYIVLICLSGFLLGKLESLAIAAASTVCFVGLAISTDQEILYSLSGNVPPSRFVQIVGFNVVAILFVGLLAARIGERKRIGEQLRKSQESFADLNILHERIVQSVDTGLITTDLDGKIYGFNRAAETISGIAETDVIGRSVASVLGNAIGNKVRICLAAISSDDFPSEYFEAELKAPDASSVTVACSISPLFQRTGGVSGLIVTLQDVTKVRQLEASLRRSDRLAAVGRMAAGLAHEIRNPLGSLSSSLQFLRERASKGSYEESLMDVVLRESERLNDIITNFLSYARPTADAPAGELLDPTDINATIEDCMVLMKHNPKVGGSHRFQYEPADVPLRSRISETQLKQVFWNLMQNSINAMPSGGDITVQLSQMPGERIQMIVEDTGPGFTQANLDHLYEPFSRAATGTGLGLSIVHKIVKENGGRIDVNSVKGAGTKVTVELPGLT